MNFSIIEIDAANSFHVGKNLIWEVYNFHGILKLKLQLELFHVTPCLWIPSMRLPDLITSFAEIGFRSLDVLHSEPS